MQPHPQTFESALVVIRGASAIVTSVSLLSEKQDRCALTLIAPGSGAEKTTNLFIDADPGPANPFCTTLSYMTVKFRSATPSPQFLRR